MVKFSLTNIENFTSVKDLVKGMKRGENYILVYRGETIYWYKIFANHICHKGLVPRVYRTLKILQ